jgi:hypothetical protein
MHDFGETPASRRNTAAYVWTACVAALIGPSLLVWIIRGAAYAMSCQPGPDACRGVTLGGGLRDALDLAWVLPNNSLLLITIAVGATVAGFFARRPLAAALCLLILPIAALVLPMLAVYSAMYPSCNVNEAGVGDCMLWGAKMGMSFHTAASVPWLIYGFAPYSFALALMLGLLGWFFSQPRAARPHAMARMRRLGDDR